MNTGKTQNRDLSQVHAPIGNLFPRVGVDADPEHFQLGPDQVAFFTEHGYLPGVRVMTDEQVEVLRADLNQLADPTNTEDALFHFCRPSLSGSQESVVFHAMGAWRIKASYHDALWNPAFTIAAGQLLGGRPRLWQEQLFCKPALHGGAVPWHQDYSYWLNTEPIAHLTCWIALDDVNEISGSLHYIPGSHRWPLLPSPNLAGEPEAIYEYLDDAQWEAMQNPLPIVLNAGEAAFHHPLLMHGSPRNPSAVPRRAWSISVVSDGVRSASNEPLLPGIPSIERGRPLEGPFFPLL